MQAIYKTPMTITKDGLDIRFVVNTLSPYLLTQRLFPLLRRRRTGGQSILGGTGIG